MESWHLISKHLSMLYRYKHATMARLMEPLGIGPGQYAYILAVCDTPGITQDRLTVELMYNKSSVARAIAQLEKNGFLRRETDQADKRSHLLYPTDKCTALLGEIRHRLGQINDQFTQGLSDDEKRTITRLLHRMANNVSVEKRPNTTKGNSL